MGDRGAGVAILPMVAASRAEGRTLVDVWAVWKQLSANAGGLDESPMALDPQMEVLEEGVLCAIDRASRREATLS